MSVSAWIVMGIVIAVAILVVVSMLVEFPAAKRDREARRQKELEAESRELSAWLDAELGVGDKVAWKFVFEQVIALNTDTAKLLVRNSGGHIVLEPTDVVDLSIEYRSEASTRGEGVFSRSLVGGVVAGSTGAIVGALSAPKSTAQETTAFGITLVTTDLKKPTWSVNGVCLPGHHIAVITQMLPVREATSVETVIPYLRAWLGTSGSDGPERPAQ